ncbi:TniQ family protein [Pseudomonas sp. GZD-209]|uniref:TniQ family protein n=1 Tax=Pseudomonas sp. GZD-209 TaxID=3404807 RepID=UPI003BB68BD3
MPRLLYVPIPLPNESILSILYRCAKHNGLQRLDILSSACSGLQFSSLGLPQWYLGRAHQVLRSDPLIDETDRKKIDAIFPKKVRINGQIHADYGTCQIHWSMLRNKLALCPACIKTGHLNIMHNFEFSEVCPIHGCIYITKCPTCGKTLDWVHLKDYHCPCSYDLSLASTDVVDKSYSIVVYEAFCNGNQSFLERLRHCMMMTHTISTSKQRHTIIDFCTKISLLDREIFFTEIDKIHDLTPSLHKRALLAPFLLGKDPAIRDLAIQYWCGLEQVKPEQCGNDCPCESLPLTRKELNYIFASKEEVSNLIADNKILPIPRQTPIIKSLRFYRCPNLCNTLRNNSTIEWYEKNSAAIADAVFTPITLADAGEYLKTTAYEIGRLIRYGLIKGLALPTHPFISTTKEWVKNFNDTYILKSHLDIAINYKKKPLKQLTNVLQQGLKTRLGTHPPPTVYYRKDLPSFMSKALKALADSESDVTHQHIRGKVIRKLINVRQEDMKRLQQLKILNPKYRLNEKSYFQLLYTKSDVEKGIAWRKKHKTLEEAAAIIGCEKIFLYKHFIKNKYITPIRLSMYYLTDAEVAKCSEHFNTYTTPAKASTEVGMMVEVFKKNFLDSGLLTPLPASHPHAIRNQVTLKRQDARDALENYFLDKEVPCRCIFKRRT